MKSRKDLSLDVYGESPMNTVPGTDIPLPALGTPAYTSYQRYTREQYLLAAQRDKSLWYDKTNEAVIQARRDGTDKETAIFNALAELMEEFYPKEDVASTSTAA